ncbi:U3-containing 90S pre-ribosomal complex subunit-domain containing protein [Tribonema minus]|uniref:U3-containing 90S pre-ribosomal complex subunit-domain containing protein n=1 Tax=Tribonema minus TaxID=303371 RepID=A0A835YSW0_9STRA|nr:U3-containing 90S pre-ribosomal complex subunit-domain containing protein [Tribonema minus]
MGDNLDEGDWVEEVAEATAEADLVEGDSDAAGSDGDTSYASDASDVQLSDDERPQHTQPPSSPPTKGKKRKLPEDSGVDTQKAAKKAAKLKELKLKTQAKRQEASAEQSSNGRGSSDASALTAQQAADAVWERCCAVLGPQLAEIELLTPWVEAEDMAVLEQFGAHTIAKLPGYIKATLPNWRALTAAAPAKDRGSGGAVKWGAGKPRGGGAKPPAPGAGSPPIVIVCSGARRCMEVIKALSPFRCQVLKLFAKHLKPAEQAKMLRRYFPIAVGTPGRVLKLAAEGAVALGGTQLLLLDAARDAKGRSVLDMAGAREDLCELLRAHVRPHLRSAPGPGALQLGLY